MSYQDGFCWVCGWVDRQLLCVHLREDAAQAEKDKAEIERLNERVTSLAEQLRDELITRQKDKEEIARLRNYICDPSTERGEKE